MGMEVVGADAAPGQVQVVDGEESLFQEKESIATSKEREEAPVFGLDAGEAAVNGTAKGVADQAPPKDAVEEWPEPKQTHAFYFVKVRSYEDPKLRAKLEQAEKEFQKKIQARSQVLEALKAKKAERFSIISELKPLTTENRQYNEAVNEKMKEMEPLQDRLGKFRNENNAMRAKSAGLCSSIEELEQVIKSLNDRIAHESISLDEEKRLVREIKQLEGTRSKVSAHSAERAKIQDSAVERDAIQDQVKLIGAGIGEVRKEQQAVRAKIKLLEEDLKAIEADMASLQEELTTATARKDKAYDALTELRRSRDLANASFHQNRTLLNSVRELAARSDIATLQELCQIEVEKFMGQWCSSKAFREDYEKRVLTSLNGRQLCRDGRMRNPDEKPIPLETQPPQPPAEEEPAALKMPVKQAKEVPAPQVDAASKDEPRGKVAAKSGSKAKAIDETDDDVNRHDAVPPKEKAKPKEVDVAKLKEMKRQEEIEKNKLALERKKKQAEKQAAKAAARAQKEAEKKLKEKEKKAKKKAAASGTSESEEQTETDTKSEEAVEAGAEEEEPAPAPAVVKKEQKETVRSRSVSKTKAPLPKVILKRKKSQAYWSWAAPAAAAAAVLAVLLGLFTYYQYYLPASTSN